MSDEQTKSNRFEIGGLSIGEAIGVGGFGVANMAASGFIEVMGSAFGARGELAATVGNILVDGLTSYGSERTWGYDERVVASDLGSGCIDFRRAA